MTSRFSAVLTAVVLALGVGAAFAIAQQVTGKASQNQQTPAQEQYRGKACGNPNRPQGVPPGNPSNNECPEQAGAKSSRATPRRVSRRVRTRRTRRGLRVSTLGQVQLPNGLSAGQACGRGRVQIQIKSGARTVSARRVNLRRDCRFSSSANISDQRLGTRPLVVIVQFLGNDVLAPRRAARHSIPS